MLEGEKATTKGGRLKKVDLNVICKWIIESWNNIPKELIAQIVSKVLHHKRTRQIRGR